MTRMVDRLDSLVAHEASPDGMVTGTEGSNGDVEVDFLESEDYYNYTAFELAKQLTELLRSLHTKRTTTIEQMFEIENPAISLWDARQRPHHQKLAGLASCGMTRQGVVEISSVGTLRLQQVEIDSDSFAELDVEDFLVEFHAAYEDMLRDFRAQRRELKRESYAR